MAFAGGGPRGEEKHLRYKTLGMMKNAGMQKDVNDLVAGAAGTHYLLGAERGRYLVTVSAQHRLVQDGFLLNTSAGHTGMFIFVMDGEGAIYSADKSVVSHHSAFLAGGPVAAAGWWQVVYGALKWISNDSGHYQPPLDYTKQVLTELKRRGVDISGVQQEWTGADSQRLAQATKARNITFERIGPKGVLQSAF
jgi:hypothetical protein